MPNNWDNIEWSDLSYSVLERLINQLEMENNNAKFNYYYESIRTAIYNNKKLTEAEKDVLEKFAISIRQERIGTLTTPSVKLLSPMHFYIDKCIVGEIPTTKLLDKFGVEAVKQLRNYSAKFYNEFTNERIALMMLEHCKGIITNDIENTDLRSYLNRDIETCKTLLRSLYTSKILNESGLKQVMDNFNAFVTTMTY